MTFVSSILALGPVGFTVEFSVSLLVSPVVSAIAVADSPHERSAERIRFLFIIYIMFVLLFCRLRKKLSLPDVPEFSFLSEFSFAIENKA